MSQSVLRKSLADEIYRSGDSDYMVSLARGLHVIQVFCDDDRGQLTIADVTRLSGLSRTVVSRCLYTLQELGFVGREGRRFFLLPKVLKLGYGYVSAASLPILAQPLLDELTQQTNSPSAVVVLEGTDVLYVAKSRPQTFRNMLTLNVHIGLRRSARITASGHVLLASLPDDQLQEYMDAIEQDSSEDGPKISDLKETIEQTRRDDFAIAALVFAKSMRALAVPIRNVLGEVVAAMVTAIYHETEGDDVLINQYLPVLQKYSTRLSRQLVD